MIEIATVDRWWALTGEFPEFRRVSPFPLKDFGYLWLFKYIKDHPSLATICEFGHGMNPHLLETLQHSHEAWGADDWQDLSYLPGRDEWLAQYQRDVVEKCPKAHLVRGLLGDASSPAAAALPENHFDLVCSVSVLEEIDMEAALPIFAHCHRLLRPGGVMVNSYDLCLGQRGRAGGGGYTPLQHLQLYVGAQRHVGFDLDLPDININMNSLLLENPTSAMLQYQHCDGENREYWGHWTTLVSVARK
jgi:SAM-dependent methyltransferase